MHDDAANHARGRRTPWVRVPALWLATGFGLGYSPILPGTVGTLLGVPLAWVMARLSVAPFVGIELALLAVGVPLCSHAARALGKLDPSAVVYDELASLPVALFLLPATWKTLLLAFVLHRFFDIVKPWPVSAVERLPGGWGVMADDLVAAVLANLVLQGVVALGWI